MSAERLRTGILGLGRRAQDLIDALAEVDRFEVCSVADRDLKHAQGIATRFGCPCFDDYRQFIIQNDFDCLMVAAGLHSCLEYVRLALKKGVSILKLPPMARTFEEATELVNLAASRNLRYDVATALRYSESYPSFYDGLQQQPLEKPFLIRVSCEVGMLPPGTEEGRPLHPDHELAWVTDQSLAGGGVLLQDAYMLMDQVIRTFGLPQQVYALCSSQASDKQQLHHLTEDSALVAMRYGERLAGEVVAVRYWDDRDSQSNVQVLGRDRVVSVDPEQLTTCDSQGTCLERTQFTYDSIETLRLLLDSYAESLQSPKAHPFRCEASSQLEVMAVMEAAYLSFRTGSPESPGRILEMASR